MIRAKILWNHDRILLSPGGEEFYPVFGVKPEILEKCEWIEPVSQARGLKLPSSIQVGMLNYKDDDLQGQTAFLSPRRE